MSAAKEQTLVELADGLMWIVLARPDALNPLSARMADEVRAAIGEAAADERVRAVLLTGAGRAFSSGADLGAGGEQPTTAEGKPDVLTGLREHYNPLILAVRELPKPVVAAVNGPAAGVGCSLALACDLVLAAESAYFLMAFANVGLTVDGGASAFLTARIGLARAAEMALLAERLPAPKALEWGLINAVTGDEALADRSEQLARRLADGPTLSYAASKMLLNEHAYPDLAAQLDREAVAQQAQAESEDFVAGVVGFLGKQKPDFKGR